MDICIECGKELKGHHGTSKTGRCFKCYNGNRGGQARPYKRIILSKDDKFFPMCGDQRGVYEHRLVMAKHLGRCLEPWEVVHHKNGIKTDNSIENLVVLGVDSHNSYIEQELKKQREQIKGLQNRVTLLELEVIRLGGNISLPKPRMQTNKERLRN